MIKVEAGSLAAVKEEEIAFAVVGMGGFEEKGIGASERVKTTVFVIHANDRFSRTYADKVDAYNKAFACDCIPELKALEDFRKEACKLVCSADADLRQVGHNAFTITWRRVVIR